MQSPNPIIYPALQLWIKHQLVLNNIEEKCVCKEQFIATIDQFIDHLYFNHKWMFDPTVNPIELDEFYIKFEPAKAV